MSEKPAGKEVGHGDSDRSQLVERLHWKPKERSPDVEEMRTLVISKRRAI